MKRARSFHVTAVSLPISQRGAQRTAQEPPRRFPTQVSRSFPDALVKTQITAGNRTPISALKESSSFHGRHTDTSEAANALNERGKAKILLQPPPPPPLLPRRSPAGSHNEHTAFQSRTTPVRKPPPTTSRSSRLRYQGAWGGSPANPLP